MVETGANARSDPADNDALFAVITGIFNAQIPFNKVAVTRIELDNDQQELIVLGTGSYIVAGPRLPP